VRSHTAAPAWRAHTLRAAAAAALLLGYADLVRGGLSVAPLLLVAAYLILIPAALLRS
jgi:hypothetical protein